MKHNRIMKAMESQYFNTKCTRKGNKFLGQVTIAGGTIKT